MLTGTTLCARHGRYLEGENPELGSLRQEVAHPIKVYSVRRGLNEGTDKSLLRRREIYVGRRWPSPLKKIALQMSRHE